MCIYTCVCVVHTQTHTHISVYVFLSIIHPAVPVPGVNIEEHLQLRQEEKRQRVIRRHRLEEGRGKK